MSQDSITTETCVTALRKDHLLQRSVTYVSKIYKPSLVLIVCIEGRSGRNIEITARVLASLPRREIL